MRFINKKTEPMEFTRWKASAPPGQPRTYKQLKGPVKRILSESLRKEQGHICCYCERELKNEDFHIEHLNPQHLKHGDDLDYSNLLCSCMRNTAKGEPLHCGKEKDNSIIQVHPLQSDCQRKFKYTVTGKINGIDNVTQETINVLGLDKPKLRRFREDAFSPFLQSEITNEEFVMFVKEYLKKTSEGKYNPFISAVEYLFKKYVK